ncbi:hypothetical protein [Candidatus Enterococcus ferrettii]|uniref:Uncharacterized protein n=1 Tax=Candidatus Enterococcus ferrettii TaxID=2815324 RepID=A0ABV0EUC2_9ENTE|nr:hypothetical protein [Enterococcus sp. 665A]MBO1339458.1 hypothetical protein [Enterococcus sp. 665A]
MRNFFKVNKSKLLKQTIPSYQLLFLIACLTCASIGWTSAKYTTSLYALSDEARSAKFSYKIDNEIFKVDQMGNEISQYDNRMNDWETSPGVNFYDIDTISGNDQEVQQKLKVVFDLEIDTEIATRFILNQTIPERPLNVEKVEFSGEGITPIIISEPTSEELMSYDIPVLQRIQKYTCTVLLRHDGRAEYDWTINPQTGQPKGYLADKYINLVPIFEQID